jgi:hypothetical protein
MYIYIFDSGPVRVLCVIYYNICILYIDTQVVTNVTSGPLFYVFDNTYTYNIISCLCALFIKHFHFTRVRAPPPQPGFRLRKLTIYVYYDILYA